MAIAIVGIGCRFPGGADTPQRFWRLLRDGVDAIVEMPPGRFDLEALYDADPARPGKLYARRGGFVDRVDGFDAEFFGISPREASRMDPQHRLLLEVVWSALEDGGQVPERLAGSQAGVFVGISSHDYGDLQTRPSQRHRLDAYAAIANAAFTAANRISYLLDLRGPSLALDSACSSSLTAVHLACQQLASGECELAIAAGVNLCLTPEPIIGLCRAGMLSPDGRSRAFDQRANGYVRGEGAGAVVLKTLRRAVEEGDPVHAVILSSVVNQDGRTPAFSIPSAEAQADMLRRALAEAGLPPTAVQYVEAHGTGTPVGDPLEAQAIGLVYGAGRAAGEACLMGSVKTNIGHLEAGAGIAGLIKTVLALEHRQIPPSLHFTEPSPKIPLEELHLRVPTALEPWPAAPGEARAGVSSFGLGGSNAHVLLGEAEVTLTPRSPLPPDGEGLGEARTHLLALSARTPPALRELAERHAEQLAVQPDISLHDLCYSAAVRRSHHEHRLALVAGTTAGLQEQLGAYLRGEERAGVAAGHAARRHTPKLAFVFSGMGPQWWGMGRQLLEREPVFREALEACDRVLRPLAGWSLLEQLGADEATSRVHGADLAHVSNLAIQIGLAALWRAWGIVPDAVVGHSSGEMAAAYTAGALTLQEVLHLAYHRGRLQHRLTGAGRMLAVGLGADAAAELLGAHAPRVSLAGVNSPGSVTLSGEEGALREIAAELERRQVFHRFLRVDVPYHSAQMEPLRAELLDCLRVLRPRGARIRIVSSVTGEWTEGEELTGDHWWRNLRQPVRFMAAVERLLEGGYGLLVEVGPHPVASAAVVECAAHRGTDAVVLPTLRRAEDERAVMLRTLARLYARGRPVEWRGLYPAGTCLRLPTYPWQRERHWYEGTAEEEASATPVGVDTGHPLLGRRLRSPLPAWEVELGDPRLAWLADHAVQESAVFPAAAYVEMALGAAGQLWGEAPVAVERLEFRKLLFLDPRDALLLQAVYRSERSLVEIHAARSAAEPDWTLHASGSLRALAHGAAPDASALRAIRERCGTPADLAACYRLFERRGLRFGPAFRGLRDLWLGEGEALGRIELADADAAASDAYRVHPALLDAAFHVLASVAMGVPGPLATVLPTGLGRVECFGRPGSSCWSHAVLTHQAGDVLEGDVRLLDDAGAVILACRGLRLQALAGRSRSARVREWLYEMHWEESPLAVAGTTGLPSPRTVAAEVRPVLVASAAEPQVRAYDAVVGPALNRVARHHVHSALRALGWPARTDGTDAAALTERLPVAPAHRPLLRRLVSVFGPPANQTAAAAEAEARAVREVARAVLDAHPEHHAQIELLSRCGSRLAEILRGEADARELLFAHWPELLTALYRSGPVARFYNAIAAEAVAVATRGLDPARPLRVLEAGAGTGGLTSAVLPRLRTGATEYLFTDVSPYFLAGAREEFGALPGVRFGVLDVEADPAAQGFAPAAFDVVLAANVIHATADVRASLAHLRRLLAPDGLLVLLELTRAEPSIEVVFGLLDGWWRFTDHDLRPAHPLLTAPQWARVLAESGFEAVEVLTDPLEADAPVQSVLLARAPAVATHPAAAGKGQGRHWLLYADRRGVAERLAVGLRERGDRCTVVSAGREFRQRGEGRFEIAPAGDADIGRLLEQLARGAAAPDAVVHLWSLDGPQAAEAATAEVMEAQRLGCDSVLHLVHALERSGVEPEICLVTAGAQAVGDEEVPGIAQAPLWGFGRVLGNEQPGLRPRLVDLGAGCTPEEIGALLAELCDETRAAEVALRGGRRWVRRLRRATADPSSSSTRRTPATPERARFELEVGTPGALETLGLREVPHVAPEPGHVLVRVLATGLNFRDVLVGLGVIAVTSPGGEPEAGTLTTEFAGVVVDCGKGVDGFLPGDEVLGLAIGALGSHAHARQELLVQKPPHLSFEEAASFPGIYATAHYALDHLARITAGERVLIHTASGGVGHAALALCRRVGAEVFATAGTLEKREYLRSLGVAHVMDSRSLAWADEVLERTGGEGIDVVLNSLAGEAIARGLEVLRPFGRFVEIGKRDIYQDASLGLLPFRRNLAFFTVDLVRLCLERTRLSGQVLRELVARIAAGELPLPPRADFDIADAEHAFRRMAQARHLGKLVLTVRRPEYVVRPPRERPPFRPDATYLITGGTGGFGLAVAEWMARQGAGHLVLMSRSGVPRDNAAALERLRRSGARVHVVRADAGREEDVAGVLATIREEMPPLRGVMHLAMVLDDALLGELDPDRFAAVMAPKVAGAWTLHRLTRDDPLEHFVLFSSIASVIGHPLQGNYAAASAFLDALAPHRRALGLPAVAIAWGTLAEVGYLSRHPEIREHVARLGVGNLTPDEAMEVLDELLRGERAHVMAARLDWEILRRWNRSLVTAPELEEGSASADAGPEQGRRHEDGSLLASLRDTPADARQARLEAYLLQRVARVLGAAPDRVEVERPLPELGLDSLLAVELLAALRLDLGVQLPVVKLLQGASTRTLAQLVLEQLGLDSGGTPPAPPAGEEGQPAAAPEPPAAAQSRPLRIALAGEQRRLWFLDRWTGGNPAYHIPGTARLTGRLDAARLEATLREVVRRHDALRARFPVVDGEPVQVIEPEVPVRLARVDLRALPAAEREGRLRELAQAEIQRPFALDHAPLLRPTLFQLAEDEHTVLLVVHHLVTDGQSMALLVREILALYDGAARGHRAALPEPPRYADYVRWQHEQLGDDLVVDQLGYWTERLAGAPAALELPFDRPRPAVQSFRGGHLPFELSAELSEALRELSRREGVTLFMTLLAAFQALLHRYSGEEDVCVGTPVATRNLPGGEALVGCCLNTLALRTDLSGDPSFRELLQRVRKTTLGAFAHQEVPFERVVEAVRPTRDPARPPLFQVMLNLRNLSWPELRIEGLAVQPLELESGTSVMDLALLLDAGERLSGTLEYATDLFDGPTAARLLGHLHTLLEGIVVDPEQRLSRLPLLTGPERQRVLVEWNDTATDFGAARCLHELFEAQAARTPGSVGVVSEEGCSTYQEMDRRANRLANRLRGLGVGPDAVVGVCLERSPELVVALLAVLKAGGAYLPLDPSLPKPRLAFMLEDARARVLISRQVLVGGLETGAAGLVLLDAHAEILERMSVERPAPRVTPVDPAYVIYTSGSSGQPKGVLVEHRAIWNQLMWRQSAFPLTTADAVLQRTPVGFDPAVWEFFAPLAAGARLVLPRPGSAADTRHLTRLITEQEVTTLQVVPSLLAALLEERVFGDCRSLRRVFCGGEVLTRELVERFYERLPWLVPPSAPGREGSTAGAATGTEVFPLAQNRASGPVGEGLLNLYGPTEAAIDATCRRCRPAEVRARVPIGHSIANVQVYVLDGALQPVPIGVPGELYIGGAGLARGYLHRPGLTAERFIPHPFSSDPGARLYRSGDRARWLPDGDLEFLGRTDEQVKIRGFRVEPGEVEAALLQHTAVREAVVTVDDDTPGERRLVAYVVGDLESEAGVDELRRFLAERLPVSMQPAAVVTLAALPRLASGKADRAALRVPARARGNAQKPYVPPRDAVELRLVQLWEEFCEVRPVGVADSFFDLGGHSLAAARLVGRLETEFGREVPLPSLFQAPTIEELARLLRHGNDGSVPSTLVPVQPYAPAGL